MVKCQIRNVSDRGPCWDVQPTNPLLPVRGPQHVPGVLTSRFKGERDGGER